MTIKMIVVFSLTAQQNKNKRSMFISQYRKYQRANDEKKTYLALQ